MGSLDCQQFCNGGALLYVEQLQNVSAAQPCTSQATLRMEDTQCVVHLCNRQVLSNEALHDNGEGAASLLLLFQARKRWVLRQLFQDLFV